MEFITEYLKQYNLQANEIITKNILTHIHRQTYISTRRMHNIPARGSNTYTPIHIQQLPETFTLQGKERSIETYRQTLTDTQLLKANNKIGK